MLCAIAALALAACGDSAEPAHHVQAARGARTVVWAVGDGADGSDDAKGVARAIESDRPDAFLYLGDVYPDGTGADFARHYQLVYGGLAGITWPTIGNHEYANRRSGYYPYWRRHGGAKPWYRVRLAGWELFSLNSEAPHGPGSTQLRWLERRLAGARGNCRLAFWHRPRFSAGTVHGDAPDVAPLWDALRGHARLVLNGHDHVMLRYRPRNGLIEYVAGSGGAALYGTRPDSRTAFSRSGVRGALRITLSRGAARLEFRSADGRVLDRSRTRCRPA
jgi:hypothetical protein